MDNIWILFVNLFNLFSLEVTNIKGILYLLTRSAFCRSSATNLLESEDYVAQMISIYKYIIW